MCEEDANFLKTFTSCKFSDIHRKVFKEKGWEEENFACFLNSPHIFHETAQNQSGKLIGFIFIQFVKDEGGILTFAIHPDFQGKGIGKTLLKQALQSGKQKGLKKLFLEVPETNEIAKKLYKNIGFKPIGKREKYYRQPDDNYVDGLTFCYFFNVFFLIKEAIVMKFPFIYCSLF